MPPSSLLRVLGDERLARLVSAGHDQAFSALYDRYHDVLVRYCASLVRDEHDALDAFQNAMLNALRALRDDRRNAPVRPWLFRIAHNEAISVLRRRSPSEPLDDRQAASLDVHRTAEDREALGALLEDLGTLTEHQRGALLMRELGGLEYDDVATALETTPVAARQAVFAARASLHDQREGRDLSCATVQRRLSDADRRASRTRAVRAHLRRCDDCRGFAGAIGRRRRVAALLPVPPLATSGLLSAIVDGAGSPAAATGGSAIAGGAVAKAAAVLATAAAAAGTTAAPHHTPKQRAARATASVAAARPATSTTARAAVTPRVAPVTATATAAPAVTTPAKVVRTSAPLAATTEPAADTTKAAATADDTRPATTKHRQAASETWSGDDATWRSAHDGERWQERGRSGEDGWDHHSVAARDHAAATAEPEPAAAAAAEQTTTPAATSPAAAAPAADPPPATTTESPTP